MYRRQKNALAQTVTLCSTTAGFAKDFGRAGSFARGAPELGCLNVVTCHGPPCRKRDGFDRRGERFTVYAATVQVHATVGNLLDSEQFLRHDLILEAEFPVGDA